MAFEDGAEAEVVGDDGRWVRVRVVNPRGRGADRVCDAVVVGGTGRQWIYDVPGDLLRPAGHPHPTVLSVPGGLTEITLIHVSNDSALVRTRSWGTDGLNFEITIFVVFPGDEAAWEKSGVGVRLSYQHPGADGRGVGRCGNPGCSDPDGCFRLRIDRRIGLASSLGGELARWCEELVTSAARTGVPVTAGAVREELEARLADWVVGENRRAVATFLGLREGDAGGRRTAADGSIIRRLRELLEREGFAGEMQVLDLRDGGAEDRGTIKFAPPADAVRDESGGLKGA